MRSKLVLLFAFTLVSALSVTAQDKYDEVELYRNGDYQGAIEVCRKELEEMPNRMDAHAVLGAAERCVHDAGHHAIDHLAAGVPEADALEAVVGVALACTVDGEVVVPQEGEFYGGWVTDEIVGPFKGESGTSSW